MSWKKILNQAVVDNALAVKLLAYITLCSSIVAVLSTVVQLAFDYNRDLQQIDQRMNQIVQSNQESMAAAIWNFDRTQLQALLNGMIKLPDMQAIQVYNERGELVIKTGHKTTPENAINRTIVLRYGQGNDNVGKLELQASLTGVYNRLLDQVYVILVTQIFKTFVVSICIIILFWRLVSRRLLVLVRYARNLRKETLHAPLQLADVGRGHEGDEISALATAINEMRAAILSDVSELETARTALQKSEERNRSLVETTGIVPWIANGETWNFIYLGPQLQQLLGVEMEQAMAPGYWSRSLAPSDLQRINTLIATEGRFESEFPLQRTDLPPLWVRVLGEQRADASGNLLQGYIYNIDQNKRTELELEKYRFHLETLVQERTAKLEQRNQELLAANYELETAQALLVQSEKMASIGQLAAGVAHEINNPIGFVSANVRELGRCSKDLIHLIDIYDDVVADLPQSEVVAVNDVKKKIDLEFMRVDLGELLMQTEDGLHRVTKIVKSLEEFSKTGGEDTWQKSSLEENIDAILYMLGNDLQGHANVSKEYAKAPDVYCYPSQVKQAIMSVLVNAVQSISGYGAITITTAYNAQEVWVDITDSGCGIGQDIIDKIFDPFFTTKPVGKGTGLGLSICYAIMKRHSGHISVRSKPGSGSLFRLAFPLGNSAIPSADGS